MCSCVVYARRATDLSAVLCHFISDIQAYEAGQQNQMYFTIFVMVQSPPARIRLAISKYVQYPPYPFAVRIHTLVPPVLPSSYRFTHQTTLRMPHPALTRI